MDLYNGKLHVIDKERPFQCFRGKHRPLLYWPDPRLNQPSQMVSEVTNQHLQLISDLFVTMGQCDGIGLAAPQIGVFERIVVIRTARDWKLTYFINPEIQTSQSNFLEFVCPKNPFSKNRFYKFREGCLSVPGYFEDRLRLSNISVRYQDVFSEWHTCELENLDAFVLQHEVDHLNGRMFVDGFSELKRERVKQKMKKALRGY